MASRRDHKPISESDIYRAAKLLIDQYGEDAALRATSPAVKPLCLFTFDSRFEPKSATD